MRVLVTGATGKQGSAVARQLLVRGHHVRAMTRTPASAAARRLAWLGAEIVEADADHPESLVRAAAGVDVMFAMTTFESGAERETARGLALVEAAERTGIRHFVFSSAPYAKEETGVPHFDSKRRIEAAVRRLTGFTILAPGFFMENFLAPEWRRAIAQGTLAMALPPAHRVDAVALCDYGALVVHVMEQAGPFIGRRIDVAGDTFSPADAAVSLSRAMCRPCEYVRLPIEWVRARDPLIARSYEWGVSEGARHAIDLAAVRALSPGIAWLPFAEWCARQRWGRAAG